jgi:hypothetical protein
VTGFDASDLSASTFGDDRSDYSGFGDGLDVFAPRLPGVEDGPPGPLLRDSAYRQAAYRKRSVRTDG